MCFKKEGTIKESQKKELWVGLVGAEQRPGTTFLGDVKGGYVNVVASASGYKEFKRKVKHALDELGLTLTEIEDPKPLTQRLSKDSVSEEILTMAETVRQIDSVAFGDFYVYNDEE